MEEDTEERILRDWNSAWTESHRRMESMRANSVDEIYRKVLAFAKQHGKPDTAKLKASLNQSEDKLNKEGGLELDDRGVIVSRKAKEGPIKKRDNLGSKIMFEFLRRIRQWRKKHSTN